ncbi:DUF948 domain-containing protein [Sporosarcina sp. P21c]|uniref:DUF948 domain-containing protein n=1 Tax=Sporosarcina TaxID=1569 RepID=UPI000A1579CA|nr:MULTISPECIES: DUF948 domain-containing protein [Sporosarcina]PIC66736.1 DUF948 domain-containing protein [Sporosarcina sp. P16a]PIC82075.1 DUF948 domain-containing protein [Sporosarcina sp. P1]PIC89871.1 DUF948 domain-containing protein [Sporosarcina sp. P21c]PIC93257.1 DUF948 domain-containing protein [Sporosarcina sp. P25]
MINLLYVAAVIAAIAFLILCVSLAKTLGSLKTSLQSVSHTVDDLSKQLEGVTTESTQLLQKTNQLAEDLQGKADKLNTVVEAVKGVGDSVNTLNQSVHRISSSVTTQAEQNSDKIAQVVQWGTVAVNLYDQVKERQPKKSAGWTVYKSRS